MTTAKPRKPYTPPKVRVVPAEPTVRFLACTGAHTVVCADAAEFGCCSYSANTCDSDCPPF